MKSVNGRCQLRLKVKVMTACILHIMSGILGQNPLTPSLRTWGLISPILIYYLATKFVKPSLFGRLHLFEAALAFNLLAYEEAIAVALFRNNGCSIPYSVLRISDRLIAKDKVK